MSTEGFTVSHARDAYFERGLRSLFEYRDLGIATATNGQVVAHVIRAAPGAPFAGQAHLHRTTFQFVYVLRGWIEFDYEGHGPVRLEAGASVYQPPSIRHRELAHSDDLEMLEIVMPADFSTEEVASVLHASGDAAKSR
ncbi:MAG TPA: cupin domain-containing protein [Casimicrobiaceae bacterium]|jgi:quercetin dioxygenase-like cupin family protein|nr:cupin domain-containing protein [Casimicrobiaceae bacterium]